MKTALTIAGSDSSGGAGIQADIKTMIAHGVYAMSAITSLTAQNTTGVKDIMEVNSKFLETQLDSIFTDIYPDAVKTGMLSSKENILSIVKKLKYYDAKNIVVDPVMISTSGSKLLKEDAMETLKNKLLPLATLITPNIPEAETLIKKKISNKKEMLKSAKELYKRYGCFVLIKGGHSTDNADDLLFLNDKYMWLYGKRIDTDNTHGTGCTLSSAIASNLAKGIKIEEAVKNAKKYISGTLEAGLNLGQGNGPVNHGFAIEL